jgi:ribonuclease H2 subunit C
MDEWIADLSASPGTQHAYFRGRHLHGTTLPLPSGYTGAVVHVTEKTVPRTQAQTHAQTQARDQELHDYDGDDDAEHEDIDESAEVKIAEQIGTFDAVVVWDHGGPVDAERDMYIRGVREWIGFAESMHVEDDDDLEDGAEAERKTAV